MFLKWNGGRYGDIEEVKRNAGVYRNAVLVDLSSLFASGIEQPDDGKKRFDNAKIDLRLKVGAAAIDTGQVLPGFNDDFSGKAPNLGAYELDSDPPHYGPRPVLQK